MFLKSIVDQWIDLGHIDFRDCQSRSATSSTGRQNRASRVVYRKSTRWDRQSRCSKRAAIFLAAKTTLEYNARISEARSHLLFDDSFSALDYQTDANLRRALKSYVRDSAVVIVAQRVATVMDADQIIVLDEGKIVGKGTHSELMETCSTYQEFTRLRKE